MPDGYGKNAGRVSEAIAAGVDDVVEPEGRSNQTEVLSNVGRGVKLRGCVQDFVGRDLVETLHRDRISSARVWDHDGVAEGHKVCAEGPYGGVVRYIFDPGGCINLRLCFSEVTLRRNEFDW